VNAHACTLSDTGGRLTLTIAGAFDAETVFDIRTRFPMDTLGGESDLVVDLSETGFMDSSGLGFLVGLRRRAQRDGWTLRLHGANGQVQRLLQRVGWPESLIA